MPPEYTPRHLLDPAPPRAVRIPIYARGGRLLDHTWVDETDALWLARWKWQAVWATRTGRREMYVGRREMLDGKSVRIFLHRELLGLPRHPKPAHTGPVGDHINGDPLDNRRCNLRIVSVAQDRRNHRRSRAYRSRFPGVSWNTRQGKWYARTTVGKRVFLGAFDNERDAGLVVEAWRRMALPDAYVTMRTAVRKLVGES